MKAFRCILILHDTSGHAFVSIEMLILKFTKIDLSFYTMSRIFDYRIGRGILQCEIKRSDLIVYTLKGNGEKELKPSITVE